MSGEQQIDYEALAQEAMRGVVRAVLGRIAKSGLPGAHHFYIAFYTQAPGVIISKRIREKYPEEMTIVLQHRFWDLAVQDDRFEVKLTFDAIPERLVVPFDAVKVFFDPSVPYGLQFEEPGLGSANAFRSTGDSDDYPDRGDTEDAMPARATRPQSRGDADKSERKPSTRKLKPAKPQDSIVATPPPPPLRAADAAAKPAPARVKIALEPVATAESKKLGPVPTPSEDADAEGQGRAAKVVQLDKFRKK